MNLVISETEYLNEMQMYIIKPSELFAILKGAADLTEAQCQKVDKELTTYGIGNDCHVTMNLRKKKKSKAKKIPKVVTPITVNVNKNISLKNISYAAATKLIVSEHGPLNAKYLNAYVKAYGWDTKKGGKTPDATFAAMLSTGASKGVYTRVKGKDGNFVYALAPPKKSNPKKSKVNTTPTKT